jgi:hypothetical protein
MQGIRALGVRVLRASGSRAMRCDKCRVVLIAVTVARLDAVLGTGAC